METGAACSACSGCTSIPERYKFIQRLCVTAAQRIVLFFVFILLLYCMSAGWCQLFWMWLIVQDLQNCFCSSDLFPSAQSYLSVSLSSFCIFTNRLKIKFSVLKLSICTDKITKAFFVPEDVINDNLLWLFLQSWRS